VALAALFLFHLGATGTAWARPASESAVQRELTPALTSTAVLVRMYRDFRGTGVLHPHYGTPLPLRLSLLGDTRMSSVPWHRTNETDLARFVTHLHLLSPAWHGLGIATSYSTGQGAAGRLGLFYRLQLGKLLAIPMLLPLESTLEGPTLHRGMATVRALWPVLDDWVHLELFAQYERRDGERNIVQVRPAVGVRIWQNLRLLLLYDHDSRERDGSLGVGIDIAAMN
jgi:hypothetical protein